MTTEELLEALARLRVETGSLACLGCGYEHNCSVHGCYVLREAADRLNALRLERYTFLAELKYSVGCGACKHLCKIVCACCDCAEKKDCKCMSCNSWRTNWEWRGQPEAPEEAPNGNL